MMDFASAGVVLALFHCKAGARLLQRATLLFTRAFCPKLSETKTRT
jgi:hypothetical protein